VSSHDRQPGELADESGRPRKKVPPTSEPIEEDERGDAGRRTQRNGSPSWNEEEPAPEHADEDAKEPSDPKDPAGSAGEPR
jgi:hypothetical protein